MIDSTLLARMDPVKLARLEAMANEAMLASDIAHDKGVEIIGELLNARNQSHYYEIITSAGQPFYVLDIRDWLKKYEDVIDYKGVCIKRYGHSPMDPAPVAKELIASLSV